MQNKLRGFYYLILSKRNFISFLSGIIVSGYVVEISLLQNLNNWHLLSIGVGVTIGIFCSILIRISENFEDNTKSFIKNDPLKSTSLINNDAWKSINDTSTDSNAILKLLPKFWLPFTTFSIPLLFVLGFLFLRCANEDIKKKSFYESQMERNKLVSQMDSIMQIQTHKHIIKNGQLKDTLTILKSKIDSFIKIHKKCCKSILD